MADKPGITTLEQLAEVRRVQAETRRIYSIMYSERFENRATVKAGELVKAGAIGRVVQTIGLGPHRMIADDRPAWFFDKPRYGGILCDIGSHQADQFLYFTGSTRAEVVASQVGNVHHPQHPNVRGLRRRDAARRRRHRLHPRRLVHARRPRRPGATAGSRSSAPTASSRSARTSTSPAGRARATCSSSTRRRRATIDCQDVELPYGRQLVDDVLEPHRDGDDAGALLPGDGAGAEGAAAGPADQVQDLTFRAWSHVSGRRQRSRQHVAARLPGDRRQGRSSASSVVAGFPAIVPASVLRRAPRRATASTSARSAPAASRAGTTCPASGSTTPRASWPCATSTAGASRTRKTLVNGYYAKKTGKPYDGVTGYARLPRAARQQGRRRRRHQHAGSLARAHRDRTRSRPARTSTCRSRRR